MSDHTLTHRRLSRDIEVVALDSPRRSPSNGPEGDAIAHEAVGSDRRGRQYIPPPSRSSTMSSKPASKMSPGAGLTLEIGGGQDDGVGSIVQHCPVVYTVAEDKKVVRKIDRVSRTAHLTQKETLILSLTFLLAGINTITHERILPAIR